MNHYQHLGLTKRSTLEEVEQAYQTHLQEYNTQIEAGIIIDQKAKEELDHAYRVITNDLQDTSPNRLLSVIILLLKAGLGIIFIFSPIFLAQVFNNDTLLVLIPVFFVSLVVLNAVLSARKNYRSQNNIPYIPQAQENRRQSNKSALWVGSILVGVCLLGFLVGEEAIDENEEYIQLVVGLVTLIWGSVMQIKDRRQSSTKNS